MGKWFLFHRKSKNTKEISVETPFGKPSDTFISGEIENMEIIFLARHGRNHTFTPSEVPYRANIWAMRSLGVKWLISASAVGSLKDEIRPLDVVIPDQFIDRTHDRPKSFFGEGLVAHVSMADPFCQNLSKILNKVAQRRLSQMIGKYILEELIYVWRGLLFLLGAESEFYRSLGCSVIGMTNHTEARLCREAEIAYSSLSMSTDYDCWHRDHENVSVEMIINNLNLNSILAKI